VFWDHQTRNLCDSTYQLPASKKYGGQVVMPLRRRSTIPHVMRSVFRIHFCTLAVKGMPNVCVFHNESEERTNQVKNGTRIHPVEVPASPQFLRQSHTHFQLPGSHRPSTVLHTGLQDCPPGEDATARSAPGAPRSAIPSNGDSPSSVLQRSRVPSSTTAALSPLQIRRNGPLVCPFFRGARARQEYPSALAALQDVSPAEAQQALG